jgi:2-oxoglutarate ferredoxin oxidoreductase subunit beta
VSTSTAQTTKVSASDFKSDLKPIWCPGCGDFGVLASLYRALAEMELDPATTVIVSGIGCSSRLPHFVSTYGFHSLHGRPLPVAMGVKLANPELTVIAVGGDGDGFAIGAGHFPHAARRNVDITYLVMDNEIYGLTKGQVSPTSLFEQKAPSTPYGNLEEPLNTLAFAIASGASFVARGASFNTKALTELIVQAVEHKGFSFVDALSPCVMFNNHQEEWKQAVTDVAPDHDVTDKVRAFELALRGGFSLGIVYREERETLDQKYQALLARSKESSVAEMLEAFSARKGAAIGKPAA